MFEFYKWYTSCLLVSTDKHLNHYELMEGAQRGAHTGCSGTVDNLLIDRMVKLDCHRRKRNLSMGWVDVKKTYDSIDHGWLEEMMPSTGSPPGCVGLSRICQEAGVPE